MRILLVGKHGQVGWELARRLPILGEVTALGREELDLTDPNQIRDTVREIEPELVVNAGAYTAVDQAEREPGLARAVNGVAPGVLGEEAARLGAALVHYSTDYLFDGEKGEPYVEDDPPNPLSTYGATKLEGEQAIQAAGAAALVLRLSWVYGLRRDSFVAKVFRWAAAHPELRIIEDQVSKPTWCVRVAEATVEILRQCVEGGDFPANCSGVYHLASQGEASRYEWARAILHHVAQDPPPKLIPAKSVDFPTPAVRPRYSVLDCTKVEEGFGIRLPDWRYDLSFVLMAQNLPEPEVSALATD